MTLVEDGTGHVEFKANSHLMFDLAPSYDNISSLETMSFKDICNCTN